MNSKSTNNFNVIDDEQKSYKRSISFLLELLVKIIIWGTVAVLLIENLSFNHILYDSSLGGLFLTWIFSIIYPNKVIKFCFSNQDKVSRVYSTLLILIFSAGVSIEDIISKKDYSFFDLYFLVMIIWLSSFILVYIYPKGTIFYPLANKYYICFSENSLSPLESQTLEPMQRRSLTAILHLIFMCHWILFLFAYGLYKIFT